MTLGTGGGIRAEWPSRMTIRTVAIVAWLFVSQGVHAQSFRETVNFIFLGDRFSSSTSVNETRVWLGNFDEKSCSVDWFPKVEMPGLEMDTSQRLTLNLKGISHMSWDKRCGKSYPLMPGRCAYWDQILQIESEQRLVLKYSHARHARNPAFARCDRSCSFIRPNIIDRARLEAAIRHLWSTFCPSGTRSEF